MRRIYVPDIGKIFVQVDQSGAEALIVAYLCRDGNFRSLFTNGVKPHVFVALHVFADKFQEKLNQEGLDTKLDIKEFTSLKIPDLKKHPEWKKLDSLIKSSDNWEASQRYYYIAKMICHSSNYGITAPAFQLNVLEKSRGRIVLTKQQAQEYLSFYHGLFPEIKEWHEEVRKQIESTRMLFNLQGFPIYCGYEINETTIKEFIARVPQSTVATITNMAYAKLQSFIEENKLDWDLLANTHDSYMSQCPIGEETECAKVKQGFLNVELTSPKDGTKFRMRSEASCGYNWAPFYPDKPEKNPNGLKEMKA